MDAVKDGSGTQGSELLDARAVAKRLSVGVRSVWRWADAGRLPRPVMLGRLKRWRALDIDAWVKNGCRPVECR